jgi:hypothetical protein
MPNLPRLARRQRFIDCGFFESPASSSRLSVHFLEILPRSCRGPLRRASDPTAANPGLTSRRVWNFPDKTF